MLSPQLNRVLCCVALICGSSFAAAQEPNTLSPLKSAKLVACITKALTPVGDAAKRIVTPSNVTYTDARTAEKINSQEYPVLIAYAMSETEVSPLLACAQKNNLKAVVRSGGHHFEAYSALSGTVVVDIAHLNHVVVSSDSKTAVVGAGTRLGGLYLALDTHNTSFPGGICPTVGIAGFLAVGGINMQMRSLGFAVEHVQSIKVITAALQILTISQTSHSDLFWAMLGGGGGTYAIALEFTLKLTALPNSAMVHLFWQGYNDSTAFDIAKRFFEWFPHVDPAFTCQLDVTDGNVTFGAWYLGKSQAEAESLMASSGIMEIGKKYLVESVISGNCNTDASRVFGFPQGIMECTPVSPPIVFLMNAAPNPFTPMSGVPQFQYNETTTAPNVMTAPSWPRIRRMSKSFIVQKDNLLKDATLAKIVQHIQSLGPNSTAVGEWHALNISGTAAQDTAFAWREKAYAHMEISVQGIEDPVENQVVENWMTELEAFLRPEVGEASYAGYADANISTNPLTSYYGNNVCRLISVKKTYDPTNFFTNPLAVPPTVPSDIKC